MSQECRLSRPNIVKKTVIVLNSCDFLLFKACLLLVALPIVYSCWYCTRKYQAFKHYSLTPKHRHTTPINGKKDKKETNIQKYWLFFVITLVHTHTISRRHWWLCVRLLACLTFSTHKSALSCQCYFIAAHSLFRCVYVDFFLFCYCCCCCYFVPPSILFVFLSFISFRDSVPFARSVLCLWNSGTQRTTVTQSLQ